MAKLRINGDSSGYVDLEAPNAASSSTLDLDQVPQKNVANTFTETQQITNTTNGAYYKINAPTSGDISSGYLVYQGSTVRGGFYTNPTHGMTHISDNYHTFRNNNANRMTIDSNGYVTTPYQPAFYAYPLGGSIASTSSYTTPGLDNTSHNIGNHWNTSTVTFTAPTAGYYYFKFAVYWNSTNGYSRLRIEKNGTDINHYNIKPGLGGDHSQEVSGIVSMSANDTIKPQVQSDQSNSYFRSKNHTYFEGYLLG